MIQWWYADNGTQAGPVDFDGLGQLMQGDTLVWHEGMGGWQAIGSLPELQGLLQPRRPQPPAPAPAPAPVSMPAPPVSARPAYQAQAQADQYAPAPKQGMSTGLKIVIGLVCAFAGIFLLILVISFGYGIWKGFNDAKRADEQRHAASQQQPATTTPPQTNTYAAPPTAGTGNGHNWQNLLTRRTVTVDEAWSGLDQTSTIHSARFAYLFTADNETMAVRIIGEDAPTGYGLQDLAAAYRRVSAGDFEFYGPEQITTINGYRVWESDAKSRKDSNYLVHVQIAITGTHCWTLITSRPTSDSSADSRLETLRTQIWSTAS